MITLISILVDIDAVAADHPALEQAVQLAARCRARVKIVDVLPRVPAGVRHFVTPEIEKELTDHRLGRLMALVEAEPEDAIARLVESQGIDTVVMGTLARTGIAGLLMGNTAERVLQRLRGSVLAVKPRSFSPPIDAT